MFDASEFWAALEWSNSMFIILLHPWMQGDRKVWKSGRDVTTGATGATEVAPKFSDTLTLS